MLAGGRAEGRGRSEMDGVGRRWASGGWVRSVGSREDQQVEEEEDNTTSISVIDLLQCRLCEMIMASVVHHYHHQKTTLWPTADSRKLGELPVYCRSPIYYDQPA
nr:hypothetical protein CFP56_69159 [Quercus suber]